LKKIAPSYRERVWGSTALEPWFPAQREKTGEVWFETDPPHPVLVKFLFAEQNLSVQVHPAGPVGVGKTEMWHILRAAPGAAIAAGFREVISPERIRESALSGEIERLLRWFPVHPGETYFIPAGTVHAIGGGVTVCEIQQNSDITYRLYDYGRPRELHLDDGVQAACGGPHPGPIQEKDACGGWSVLAECEHFTTHLLRNRAAASELPAAPRDQFVIGLSGQAVVCGVPVHAGEVWLAAADEGPLAIEPRGTASLLRAF
jgi:mannose-6-phosphate isomerase